jgi:hypothetical protein
MAGYAASIIPSLPPETAQPCLQPDDQQCLRCMLTMPKEPY